MKIFLITYLDKKTLSLKVKHGIDEWDRRVFSLDTPKPLNEFVERQFDLDSGQYYIEG